MGKSGVSLCFYCPRDAGGDVVLEVEVRDNHNLIEIGLTQNFSKALILLTSSKMSKIL